MNRCADRRPTWAELRIVLNGLKRGQAALNCGRSGPEARNNHFRFLPSKTLDFSRHGHLIITLFQEKAIICLHKKAHPATIHLQILCKENSRKVGRYVSIFHFRRKYDRFLIGAKDYGDCGDRFPQLLYRSHRNSASPASMLWT